MWPEAGSAGINQTENYTHSSAELAKEKYLPHCPEVRGGDNGWGHLPHPNWG